jgi:hypothetical protein
MEGSTGNEWRNRRKEREGDLRVRNRNKKDDNCKQRVESAEGE